MESESDPRKSYKRDHVHSQRHYHKGDNSYTFNSTISDNTLLLVHELIMVLSSVGQEGKASRQRPASNVTGR